MIYFSICVVVRAAGHNCISVYRRSCSCATQILWFAVYLMMHQLDWFATRCLSSHNLNVEKVVTGKWKYWNMLMWDYFSFCLHISISGNTPTIITVKFMHFSQAASFKGLLFPRQLTCSSTIRWYRRHGAQHYALYKLFNFNFLSQFF